MRTENWEVIPDDRQTRIETIGGLVVQDFGHIEAGDSYSCSVTLSTDAGAELADYWHNRTLVTVRDVAGREIPDMRVIIKKYSYIEHYEEEYYRADLEFWRA